MKTEIIAIVGILLLFLTVFLVTYEETTVIHRPFPPYSTTRTTRHSLTGPALLLFIMSMICFAWAILLHKEKIL